MHYQRPRLTAAMLACAAVLGLAACDNRNADPTAGEKVDAAINTMETKADAVGAELKQGVEAAKDATAKVVDRAADAARDAAITAQIHADLARDPELSTLKIDVETKGGKVLLQGTAPNDAASERAAAKAQAVSGVTAVDNQLRVTS